ncbi:MAG TPA: TetR/AcrR family transcriptional regulator [Actinomycetota bacterium]|jgi:AcrR family transcriptional regulator|nr:TetR/AcrR family transcriptional regulator [Actinomycetota bacterium]
MEARRRVSREERRRRLLASAEELFGRQGYRKTEVEEVARRAGVTKPMLYRHFPGGKAEVFMAVLDEHINSLLRGLWEAMGSSTNPRERLHRGIDAYLRFAEANPEAFQLMILSSVELDPVLGSRLREVRESIVRGLTNTISDVMKGAGLHARGAPLYANALLGAVESVVGWWLESGAGNRDLIVDHLLAFVWRGFDGLPRDPARFHVEHFPIRKA